MDDAGARVTRYLLMQLIVNVTYGIAVAIGLYFIGVALGAGWFGAGDAHDSLPGGHGTAYSSTFLSKRAVER